MGEHHTELFVDSIVGTTILLDVAAKLLVFNLATEGRGINISKVGTDNTPKYTDVN